MTVPSRRGFTLLEVLVAAMVAAVVLLGADLAYEQLAGNAHALAGAARAGDMSRTQELGLRRLVQQIDVSPRTATGAAPRTFGGDARRARFTSWCPRPGGWERECDVLLEVVRDTAGIGSVVATTSSGDTAGVVTGKTPTVLRYLLDARNGGNWLAAWGDGPTAPLAIGIIAGTDTTVLRIGARG